MAQPVYQPVDRGADAVRILDLGGIARARFAAPVARQLGTRAAYLVPSRQDASRHYYVHPRLGCECPDWQYRRPAGGCAHMVAAAHQEQRDRAGRTARSV